MTRRAAHLRHHPGQVSSPGGKREPDDGSLVDTALRESHEELGIGPAQIDVFGQLPPVKSRSGFQVTPVIGRLVTRGRFSPDPQEVAHVFELPLRLLSARENFIRLHLTTERQEVWFLRYRDELIWGITAEILYQLATQLFPDHSPPGHQNVTCLTMSNKNPLTPSMVVE